MAPELAQSTFCSWSNLASGTPCEHCGYRLKRDYTTSPQRTCRGQHAPQRECPHLLDPTGDTTRVFGCGCASSRANGIEVSVFECGLYGRCVIFPRGTHLANPTIRRCATCEKNPQKRDYKIAPPKITGYNLPGGKDFNN